MEPVLPTPPAVATAPEPTFEPVTAPLLQTLRGRLAAQPWRTCDFTLGGIGLWADWFSYRVWHADGALVISGQSEADPSVTAFSMPLGGDTLEGTVEALAAFCRREGLPLRFSAVPEEGMERLRQIAPQAAVHELTAWADYLYDIEALASLHGKAYNKKRNHVNRFRLDHPHAALLPLEHDAEARAVARAFLERLRPDPAAASPMALYEHEKAIRALGGAFDELGFVGAILAADGTPGTPVAVTFGEVQADTLHLHAEKMDHTVAGAGEAVNSLFAARMLELHRGLRYVNRQDDAGDESLRQAKLTWHPCDILKKFEVVF